MSILKKNALAIALVAGLGLAGNASAYKLSTGDTATDTNAELAAPVMVANSDIVSAATLVGINEAFNVTLQGGDFILGRTTGFTVRYNLTNGAVFGEVIDNTDITVGAAGQAGTVDWTASVIAGGTIGSNFIVIKMDPPNPASPTDGLVTGDLISINAAASILLPSPPGTGQILKGLTALQTAGAVINAELLFVDPTTSQQILPSGTQAILKSGNPVVVDCDTNGDIFKTIDVGATADQGSKTFFSSTGEIGLADSGHINLGSISTSVNPDFTFSYSLTDEVVSTLSGDFSAFDQVDGGVFLSSNFDCSTADIDGVINADGTVTFEYTVGDVVGGNTDGFSAYVCALVPDGNETVIPAGAVSVSTTVTHNGVDTSNTCSLLPLRYNGSVVDVYAINPAGNSTAQSFLRVINPSAIPGTVTIVGTDDSGNESDPVSFDLAAGASMQVNSEDLENGNAAKGLTGSWGNGAGKWRAVVTGEFAGMRVQSLNRNYSDGTVTNLTDADGAGEQSFNKLFDNSGDFFPMP